MKSIKAVVFDRGDLLIFSKNKKINDIDVCDLKLEAVNFNKTHCVSLFIDTDQKTKILKNRYGDNGSGVMLDFTNRILDEVLKDRL